MNRLVVRSEDTYWMPEPPTAIGGVRTALTSYDLRVDQTAYTTLALLAGIRADSSAKAPVLGGDDDASRRSLGLPSADAEPSVPAAELLTERTAVRLLLDVELLTGREIVDGPIEVRRSARRNHNLSVRTTGGLGFLIKQARIPESVATLRNEASVLNALASCDGMTGNIPRLAHYNAPLAALILELLPGQPLRASLRQLREWHMLRLGGALAQAHTVQPGGLRQDHRVPLGIALHRPTLELLRDASRANVQLLEAVHTDSYLCEHLASLEASWQQSHFIHGDIKLDNVVANDLGDTKELVIVDWEAASWGEGRWDVGCAIGEVMHAWVVEAVGRELGLPSLARVSNDHAPRQDVSPGRDGFTGPLAPMT